MVEERVSEGEEGEEGACENGIACGITGLYSATDVND